MPYHLIAEDTFLRAVCFGSVTVQDLHDVLAEGEQAERLFAVAPNNLTDLSQVVALEVTYSDLLTFAIRRRARLLATTIKSAIVAPWPMHLVFARMLQTMMTRPEVEIQIFPTLAAAEMWLTDA